METEDTKKKTKRANSESYGVDTEHGAEKILKHPMFGSLANRHRKMFVDIYNMTFDDITDQQLSFLLGVSSGTIAQQRNGRAYKDGHKLTAWDVITNAMSEKKETAAERIKAEAKAEAEKAAHAATINQIKMAMSKGMDAATLMMCGFSESDIIESLGA